MSSAAETAEMPLASPASKLTVLAPEIQLPVHAPPRAFAMAGPAGSRISTEAETMIARPYTLPNASSAFHEAGHGPTGQ